MPFRSNIRRAACSSSLPGAVPPRTCSSAAIRPHSPLRERSLRPRWTDAWWIKPAASAWFESPDARARDLLLRLGAATALPDLGEARTGRLAELPVLTLCVTAGGVPAVGRAGVRESSIRVDPCDGRGYLVKRKCLGRRSWPSLAALPVQLPLFHRQSNPQRWPAHPWISDDISLDGCPMSAAGAGALRQRNECCRTRGRWCALSWLAHWRPRPYRLILQEGGIAKTKAFWIKTLGRLCADIPVYLGDHPAAVGVAWPCD